MVLYEAYGLWGYWSVVSLPGLFGFVVGRIRTFMSFMLCMAKPRSSTSRALRVVEPFALGVPAGVGILNDVSKASRREMP